MQATSNGEAHRDRNAAGGAKPTVLDDLLSYAQQVLAHMDHPNVVKYLAAYAEDTEIIIVMEYCEV